MPFTEADLFAVFSAWNNAVWVCLDCLFDDWPSTTVIVIQRSKRTADEKSSFSISGFQVSRSGVSDLEQMATKMLSVPFR